MAGAMGRWGVGAFLLLAPTLAQAQIYSFLRPERDEWEAENGLMAPAGSLIIYYDSQGPVSFIPMMPKEIPADAKLVGEVFAKACQWGIGIPIIPPTSPTSSGTAISVTKGDGSYRRTLEKLRERYPGLRGVFDLKVDDQFTSVLAVFRRQCTIITARGFN